MRMVLSTLFIVTLHLVQQVFVVRLAFGTNRMNVYVVAQATQGVADYLNAHYENPTMLWRVTQETKVKISSV